MAKVLENVPLADLTLDPKNARKHSKKNLDSIKGSLSKFGQQKPIVIDADGKVIAGNGTLAAAIALGWETIQVVRTELFGSDAVAYALADNRTAELAEWDELILGDTLKSLDNVGFDIESIGFDPLPVNNEGNTDPDDIPGDVETRCKLGELWILGEHRLLCGDSTKIDQVEMLMGGEKANILLTDPPYGVSYAEKNAFLNMIAPASRIQKRIENDHGSIDESGEIWLGAFSAARANSFEDASFYIFSPQGGDLMMMMMIQKACWTLKHMLVWVKNNHVLGRCDYHYKHEPVFYGWADTHKFYGGSSCFSVLQYPKPMKNDLHPTMKPIELLEHLIGNSSLKGGNVLDVFLGSGSTLIACEKTGRRCFGMEIDPHYCDVIITRWEQFTGKTAHRSDEKQNGQV